VAEGAERGGGGGVKEAGIAKAMKATGQHPHILTILLSTYPTAVPSSPLFLLLFLLSLLS